ncbi:MAG: hypothetical protein ACTSR8_17880 [Promethearchaeota archaeon]
MSNIELIDYVIIVCHLIVISTVIIAGIFFLKKMKDKSKDTKHYLLGISFFFICYGIAQGIMAIFEITFNPFIWRIHIDDFVEIFKNNPDLALRYEITWRLQQAISSIGIILLIYQLERRILEKKTKYIFTSIKAFTTFIAVSFGTGQKDQIGMVTIINYLGSALVIIIPLFYIYLAIKTSGETRQRALVTALGLFILFFGVVFNSSIGKRIFTAVWGMDGLLYTYYLFAACVLIGTLVYIKTLQY